MLVAAEIPETVDCGLLKPRLEPHWASRSQACTAPDARSVRTRAVPLRLIGEAWWVQNRACEQPGKHLHKPRLPSETKHKIDQERGGGFCALLWIPEAWPERQAYPAKVFKLHKKMKTIHNRCGTGTYQISSNFQEHVKSRKGPQGYQILQNSLLYNKMLFFFDRKSNAWICYPKRPPSLPRLSGDFTWKWCDHFDAIAEVCNPKFPHCGPGQQFTRVLKAQSHTTREPWLVEH